MSDERTDEAGDLKAAFLRAAPRRIVEIKAALGALIADPASARMRDELRRRLQSVYALARGHDLASLADGLRLCLDQVDATRALTALSRAHLDRLAALVASLNGRLELDTRDPAERVSSPLPPRPSPLPGAESSIPGVDALARSINLGRASMRSGPAPGSVPLPGAAAQVIVGLAPARSSAMLESLPTDVEVHVVVDREEAVRRARETSAELVIVESAEPFDGVGVAASLRADSLTDFIPVALVAAPEESVSSLHARCPSAVEVLPDDAGVDALRGVIERVLRGGPTVPPPPVTDLREATVEELSRALQDEIHRGLVVSADPMGRETKVSLGEGSEVLSAAWRAIAQIRDLVEKRSHGAVRFEVPVSPRGLPGTEVLSVGVDPTDDSAWVAPGEDPLPGRKALVVDDDPKVVAQFAQTLRAAGMTVYTRTDGRAALEVARAMRPDVVLSDILMPGMDGFALCRAIRRDVLLRHTPVILLSWKEDLLVRMRELGAQAQGYLRKEARIESVVARVRATLRLRARTQKRVAELPWGAQVRGRVERVGLPLLLESAAGIEDATVTLGDSVSVTEIELRKGRLVSVTRTMQDGSVLRGEEALALAVATPSARFGVRRASSTARANLDGTVPELLRAAARRVGALEDALSGAGLLQVHRAVFDADVANAYARALPAPMRALVERMMSGEAPRDLVLRDGVSPAELEPILVELARRGAVRQVLGRDAEDLAAVRLASPESIAPPELVESVPPVAPPIPTPRRELDSILPQPAQGGDGMEFELGESLADAVFRQLTQTVGARAATEGDGAKRASVMRGATPAFGTPPSLVGRDESRIEPLEIVPLAAKIFDSIPPAPSPPSVPPTDLGPLMEPEPEPETEVAPSIPSIPAPLDAPRDPSAPHAAPREEPAPSEDRPPPPPRSIPTPAPTASDIPPAEIDALARTADDGDRPTPSVPLLVPDAARPSWVTPQAAEPAEVPAAVASVKDEAPAAQAVASADVSGRVGYIRPLQSPPEDPDTEAGIGRTLRLVLLVVAAGLASYFAVRVFFGRRAQVEPERIEAPAPAPAPAQGVNTDAGAAQGRVEDAGTGYAEPAQFLDGGALAEGSGLLVVPAPRPGTGRVEVVVEHIGEYTAPAVIPLPEDVYRVRFETGRIRSVQFATVRRGWALVRPAPSER